MRWAGLIGAVLLVVTTSSCAGSDYYKKEREAIEAKLNAAGFKVWPEDGSFPREWTREGSSDAVTIEKSLGRNTHLYIDMGGFRNLRCNDITGDPPTRMAHVKGLGIDAAIAQHDLKCVLP